ncbi:unnamed protein product [Phytophthora lilii]|uniref:Unnamed protein product n=1 Tax=Phytophthora lilii TaxID=2077276 RepID=A0A9W6U999_9STRA|nr:unnamed protein product [Phytophthora lilii]
MSEALKALESASRRELQALAKELQLCRGNAKSDVIMSHAMQFLDDHPADGEQQVLSALGGSGSSTPVASPVAKKEMLKKDTPKKETPKKDTPKKETPTKDTPKKETPKKDAPKKETPKKETPKKVTPKKVTPKKQEAVVATVNVNSSAKTTKSDSQQPEDEPAIKVDSVQVVETKVTTPAVKKTPTKISAEVAKDAKKVTPKDKKKAKQVPSPTAAAKTAPTTASPAKSPKPSVGASPSTKKSPSSKAQSAPMSKKAEIKALKAVEALVKSVADLTFVGESRVRCSTTGHEMKAEVDVIKAYINGKRYQKARNLKLSFAKYAPMFVDHPDESKTEMLWCNVTELAIARDLKRVKEHMAAPKYQKQLPIWKEQEAAKKKAEEEEAQRRAARIAAAKKRRLEAAQESGDDAAESERPAKRKRVAADSK